MVASFSWGQDFLELIFPAPKTCLLCGRSTSRRGRAGFCPSCLSQLVPVTGPQCARCGKPLPAGSCRECSSLPGSFRLARAVGYYTGFLRQAIHQYKILGRRSLAPGLAQLMAAEIYGQPAYARAQVVVPVPLHRRKLLERGFNQAQLLAGELAGRLGLPVHDHLIRIEDTQVQGTLSRSQRLANLAGAFALDPGGGSGKLLAGQVVLLVDDVFTTGATAHFAAKTLLSGGAREVLVFTLALGEGRQKNF